MDIKQDKQCYSIESEKTDFYEKAKRHMAFKAVICVLRRFNGVGSQSYHNAVKTLVRTAEQP